MSGHRGFTLTFVKGVDDAQVDSRSGRGGAIVGGDGLAPAGDTPSNVGVVVLHVDRADVTVDAGCRDEPVPPVHPERCACGVVAWRLGEFAFGKLPCRSATGDPCPTTSCHLGKPVTSTQPA